MTSLWFSIVNFEQVSHIILEFVSIVNFEQVKAIRVLIFCR